jgi:aminopeptidase
MGASLQTQQKLYAELLIKIGVNLQPGQALRIGAELEHREFARLVCAAAYQAGARYVQMDWADTPIARNRLLYSQPDYLDFFPEYEVARHHEMADDRWARLTLVGAEFPTIFDDVDPAVMRRVASVRSKKVKFYTQAVMASQIQWCVAAVPTAAWAKQVFDSLSADEATTKLWQVILRMCRVDQTDPVAAWRQHDHNLKQVANFMARNQVRSIRYFDPTPGPDDKPATDLMIGLTDHPVWIGGSSFTPGGVEFQPNMPTEEVFTTPHNQRAEGWVRTSKPAFPFEREVTNAYFRFAQGELVEFQTEKGQEVLEQFFQIPGARRLGEVSLVDERSPVNQSGLIFYETLFDENAVCHMAFGRAYPEGLENGSALSEEELRAQGVNESDTHVDFMIGTPSMQVTGLCQDGREVLIMHKGQFTPEVLGG